MWMLHARADLLDQRENDQCGDGVRDECRDHKNQRRKDQQDRVEAETLDPGSNRASNRVEEPGRGHGFAQTQTACGKNDDRPEEIVEILLGQNARAKEEHHRDDRNHPHVSKDVLELMADTPQHDSHQRDDDHKPLHPAEPLGDWPDGDNRCAARRLESDQEQGPDQQNRNNAHRQCNEEPCAPADARRHVLQCDDVLR